MDPASLQVDRRARRVKTDAIDVEALLRTLIAWSRGEIRVCRMVRVPTVAEEDARRLHRERKRLVAERIAHVNRMKSLLALHGVGDYQPLRSDRHTRLEGLVGADGCALPPQVQRELERELARLELVMAQIAEVETARDAVVTTTARPEDDRFRLIIANLTRPRGIGPEIATVLVREIFYRCFGNRRQVASYAGLTPSPYASGGTSCDQGISKAGNALVRTTMIELAWLWLRYQSDSALSRWFRERAGKTAGRIRRIMIVAVARKLLVVLWRYVNGGLVPILCGPFAEPTNGNRSPLVAHQWPGRKAGPDRSRVNVSPEIWPGRDAAAPESMGPVLLEPRQPREWEISRFGSVQAGRISV